MLEDSSDPVLIHRDDSVVWANPAAAHLLGYANAYELRGQSVSALLEEGGREALNTHLAAVLAQGEECAEEFHLLTRQGTCLQAELCSTRIEFENANAVRTILRDLLLVRELERATADDREEIERLGAGLLIVDGSCAIREASRRALELVGYSQFVLQSLDLPTLAPDADSSQLTRVRNAVRAAARGTTTSGISLTLRHRSGRPWQSVLDFRPSHRPGRAVVVIRSNDGGQAQPGARHAHA